VRLDADSGRMEALLTEAARLQGEERLSVLLRALEFADAGPYLPGVESGWAGERRQLLDARIVEARLVAAQLAFTAERFGQAEELVERVLASDPYKESAWRLAMRIASALGDEDRVIATFRRCRASLEELDLVPSDATSSLLTQLRR
jgi:DNA-binding SARP family transcriptional activator